MSTKPVTCYLDEKADVSQYILRLTRLERQVEIRKLLNAGFQALYPNNVQTQPALISRSHENPQTPKQPATEPKSVALTNLINL